MNEINKWLEGTKLRAITLSEAYQLQLSKLWWANLMFVVLPATFSTAAAIFAALPPEKDSLPVASILAGGAAVHCCRICRLVAHGKFRCVAREFPGFLPAALQCGQALAVTGGIRRLGLFGPVDVSGSRTVTGFAGDVDFAERRLVGLAGRVVALVQIGRMALGALQGPVVVDARPVQGVRVVGLLLGI